MAGRSPQKQNKHTWERAPCTFLRGSLPRKPQLGAKRSLASALPHREPELSPSCPPWGVPGSRPEPAGPIVARAWGWVGSKDAGLLLVIPSNAFSQPYPHLHWLLLLRQPASHNPTSGLPSLSPPLFNHFNVRILFRAQILTWAGGCNRYQGSEATPEMAP